MKNRFSVNVYGIKKLSLIIFLLVSVFLKAQPTCTNLKFRTDMNQYNLSGADSVFVKYIQFDISDTSNVSSMIYTFSDLTAGTQLQKTYSFHDQSNNDLTVAYNHKRNKETVKISFGYFKYADKNYTVNIKLYDSSNNMLSSTDFNFSH